ncbi:MAG: hypothetical protein WA810_10765 [Maribacter sp.]
MTHGNAFQKEFLKENLNLEMLFSNAIGDSLSIVMNAKKNRVMLERI